jgi:hypothetical protein
MTQAACHAAKIIVRARHVCDSPPGSAKVEPVFGHADVDGVSGLEGAVEQQDCEPVAELSLDDPP